MVVWSSCRSWGAPPLPKWFHHLAHNASNALGLCVYHQYIIHTNNNKIDRVSQRNVCYARSLYCDGAIVSNR